MKHHIFKLDNKNASRVIIFIPDLYRLYYAERSVARRMPNFITTFEKEPLKSDNQQTQYLFNSAMLILTNRCNLSCIYCYGECGPKRLTTMREEVVYAVIDYIIDCALQLDAKKVKLGFFGGEPTLVWTLMMKAVKYFRLKTQEASLKGIMGVTTNGVMDVKKASWIAKNMNSITLSLDGIKFIHDMHRSNSFDKAFASGKIIYDIAPSKLNIRTTVSNISVEYLSEIANFFGKNFPGCVQRYEPLFAMGRAQDANASMIGPPDPAVFFDKIIEAISIVKGYKSIIRTSVLQFRNYSKSFCGVNGRSFNVTYDGSVVSCHRMIEGDKNITMRFCYGRFDEQFNKFVFDEKRYNELQKLSFGNIPECRSCFAQYFCKGDCPVTKAVLCPDTFQYEKSYRCKEVREFVKNILKYILDKGYQGLIR